MATHAATGWDRWRQLMQEPKQLHLQLPLGGATVGPPRFVQRESEHNNSKSTAIRYWCRILTRHAPRHTVTTCGLASCFVCNDGSD
mmetsp:Transcript_12524/g.24423  ORF Transcript_12524/g.24423 Transcript_12524/m.24423 type:complete len:86 (+) Transcript_12524:62-319(+)